MSYFNPALTDPEMLASASFMEGYPVRTLAQRLALRRAIACSVREDLARVRTLQQAGELAQALVLLDECRARLDWSSDVPR
ncbi:hypothetical protein UFOVP669_46 [uncultured Caudovirales phage]|uniref:Uncharacterized protein n=1 Tax=uncultured Caudovirales phage TaxID=2100421 RepID=A0A6J5M2X6_9CAUD|nr:hypothetical protein UFOVP400_37 [uncultured Caudovirales phage]CAB4156152.1 hypothetical protein UFOVP669_46 [uncultured Caudovirales phage]CAB4213459.1 hypothetical protein UFOVP1449_26 [uncultured Caudovirales phage]